MQKIILNRQLDLSGNSGGGSTTSNSALANMASEVLACDSSGIIWTGANGGAGNTFYNFYVPNQTKTLTYFYTYCTQAAGPLGTGVKFGYYNGLTGDLIGESYEDAANVGFMQNEVITPFEVIQGQPYYIGMSCTENGAQFLLQSGKWVGAGPSLSFESPNKKIPINYGSDIGNKKSFRYLIGAG